jgi:hypothetical protein
MINCLAVVGSYRGVKAHSFFKLFKAPNANELAFQIVISNVAFRRWSDDPECGWRTK